MENSNLTRNGHFLTNQIWRREDKLHVLEEDLTETTSKILLTKIGLLEENEFGALMHFKHQGVPADSLRRWLLASPTPEHARMDKELNGSGPSNQVTRIELENEWKNDADRKFLGVSGEVALAVTAIVGGVLMSQSLATLIPNEVIARDILKDALLIATGAGMAEATRIFGRGAQKSEEILTKARLTDPKISPDAPPNPTILRGLFQVKPKERILLRHLDEDELRSFLAGDIEDKQKILQENPIPMEAWFRFLGWDFAKYPQAIADLAKCISQGKEATEKLGKKLIQSLQERAERTEVLAKTQLSGLSLT